MSLRETAANMGQDLYTLQLGQRDLDVCSRMADRALCLGGCVPAVLERELATFPLRPAAERRLGTAIEDSADYFVRMAFSAGWHIACILVAITRRVGHSADMPPNLNALVNELQCLDKSTDSMAGGVG